MNEKVQDPAVAVTTRQRFLETAYVGLASFAVLWMAILLCFQIYFLYTLHVEGDSGETAQKILGIVPKIVPMGLSIPPEHNGSGADASSDAAQASGFEKSPFSVGLAALAGAILGFFMAKFAKHLDEPNRKIEFRFLVSLSVIGLLQLPLYFFVLAIDNPDAGMIDGTLIQLSLAKLVENSIGFAVLMLSIAFGVKS